MNTAVGIFLGVLIFALAIHFRKEIMAYAGRTSSNTSPNQTPPPTTGGFGALWKKWVHENPLIVGLASLALMITVASVMYGGLGWLWINPKLTWSIALILIASAILPAFKPNPAKTSKRAIYLSIGLVVIFNLPPVLGETFGGALGQIFSPKTEQTGMYLETSSDITVYKTSDPEHPLVVGKEWSKPIWFDSGYPWAISSEGNKPYYVQCGNDTEQLNDPSQGKLAHVDQGRSCRIRSVDGKPLKIYFRRKGLVE